MSNFRRLSIGLAAWLVVAPPSLADDSALVRLLKSGKIPVERQAAILAMIGQRGTAADLAYAFRESIEPTGIAPESRRAALEALATAMRNRGVAPAEDLTKLGPLIKGDATPPATAEERIAATSLAGLWKDPRLAPVLVAAAEDERAKIPLRGAALDALAAMQAPSFGPAILKATEAGPLPLRARALAALARLDPEAAAARTATLLPELAAEPRSVGPVLDAFVNRRGGSETLAAALDASNIAADPAKVALRYLYSIGQTDPALVTVLSDAAGISAEAKVPTPEEVARLSADVLSHGNAERGEAIFRREDVNCMKCHAVSGAGGDIGPDLSAIGGSSPVDYLVNSILQPAQAVKEEYQVRTVLTVDGQVFQGVVKSLSDQEMKLKEATGGLRTIAVADIEDQKSGGSLMPAGLTNFLTRDEVVDLVRFLSELGKPGAYAIRSSPTIQRWRVLPVTDPGSLGGIDPDGDGLPTHVLNGDASMWRPAYARTAGALPLDELTAATGANVFYLEAEFDVARAGRATLMLDSVDGIEVWLDRKRVPLTDPTLVNLDLGHHTMLIHLDRARRAAQTLRVEFAYPPSATVVVNVVGGP